MGYSWRPLGAHWHPDPEFLEFLETIEQNSIMFGGDALLREHMRRGTALGRELYANSYRHLKDRYELYKRLKGATLH